MQEVAAFSAAFSWRNPQYNRWALSDKPFGGFPELLGRLLETLRDTLLQITRCSNETHSHHLDRGMYWQREWISNQQSLWGARYYTFIGELPVGYLCVVALSFFARGT